MRVVEDTLVYEQGAKEVSQQLVDSGTVVRREGHTARCLRHIEEGSVHEVQHEVVKGRHLDRLPHLLFVHLLRNTQASDTFSLSAGYVIHYTRASP